LTLLLVVDISNLCQKLTYDLKINKLNATSKSQYPVFLTLGSSEPRSAPSGPRWSRHHTDTSPWNVGWRPAMASFRWERSGRRWRAWPGSEAVPVRMSQKKRWAREWLKLWLWWVAAVDVCGAVLKIDFLQQQKKNTIISKLTFYIHLAISLFYYVSSLYFTLLQNLNVIKAAINKIAI